MKIEKNCISSNDMTQGKNILTGQVFPSEKSFMDLGILGGLDAHIAILDEEGRVIEANKSWHEFLPGTPGNFFIFDPGTNYLTAAMNALSVFPGRDLDPMHAGIKNVLTGVSHRFELKYALNSANLNRWLQVEVTSLSPGALVFHRDITDQETLEKHHQQANKMEAIGTLAGGIAHDFNNILAGIIGYSELVKEDVEALGGVDKKIQERLDNIIGASMRAKDLIHQILTFSRSGREVKHPITVSALVKEVAQFLRASLPATIEIDKSLHSDGQVMADPTHIHQILMNLCANARDAMGETGGSLSIHLKEVILDGKLVSDTGRVLVGPFIRLSVGDTGSGIDPEIAGKIMEPFFTTKPKEKGTGMGLSVVHGIVRSLDGGIFISARKPSGTWFDVYLPLHGKAVPPAIEEVSRPVEGGSEHILFVDDEEALTQIARDLFSGFGYRVTAFSDSIDALEVFKENPGAWDLVISDITMPVLPGDALVKEIRRIRPDLPVILITGASARMDKNRAERLGINALLYKPMIGKEMAMAIRRVLDGECLWPIS
jgi:signal transduction histidine kinase/ActR/RegA family two-component response regulator